MQSLVYSRHGDAVVVAEVRGEHVGGGAEAALVDAGAHDVGDVGADGLGDGRDVGSRPSARHTAIASMTTLAWGVR